MTVRLLPRAAEQSRFTGTARGMVQIVALTLVVGAGHAAGIPRAVGGAPLPSLAPMLKRITPAVVNIAARGRKQAPVNPLLQDPFFRRFFDAPRQLRERRNLGSGVVVDAKRGYLLTNHHVVDDASEITVTLRDGRRLQAELIGRDPDTDVAVLRVPAESLVEIPIADSKQLQVGDFVVAIGNPFGLGQTVTSGIVSALGRRGLGIEGYEDFIQTDASINVGNSGGALVNLRGELVGINSAIFAPNGGSVGIGFAIPSSMALSIMRDLIDYGRVRRGMLGVRTSDLTPRLAQAFLVPGQRGALIEQVSPESPAERAGLRRGDIIIGLNGKSVENSGEVGNAIGLERVGSTVRITVLRDAGELELSAMLAARAGFGTPGLEIHSSLAGAFLADAAGKTRTGEVVTFVRVFEIEADSSAWQIGLRRGDLITSVNRNPVQTIAELAEVVRRVPGSVTLNLRRGNTSRYVVLE